jgi:ech hydrogenase subunit B
MTSSEDLLVMAIILVLSPFAIGLLMGLDRKLTARMQNRVGPPILQPFYDLFKLFGKERRLMNNSQAVFGIAAMLLQAAAFVLLVTGGDLLILFFVSGAGSFSLVMGAFSARSPFSYFGAQRELLQILAYEPVLFMAIFAIGYREGTFLSNGIGQDLIVVLPLALLALLPVVLIKMEKSPYDIAVAHTELISGPYVEYSGRYLAYTEIAHWFELGIVFGIMTLFFQDPNLYIAIAGKVLIVLAFFLVALIIDNSTARLTRTRMVKFTLAFGMTLTVANILIVFLADQGVFRWP